MWRLLPVGPIPIGAIPHVLLQLAREGADGARAEGSRAGEGFSLDPVDMGGARAGVAELATSQREKG